ncbi:uncharacterized protein LOC132394739 isoform X2 [Hypanus sabinus]|uniref:uncharacterized protein LOC132394739 isoform X2 n=1 Tax=Hypanus sabinus TaxID=79690 RepID=UPI0028C3C5B9|nr:uncharacterized protein LOC132394739 isoform X2 [Hypanus sabinus]
MTTAGRTLARGGLNQRNRSVTSCRVRLGRFPWKRPQPGWSRQHVDSQHPHTHFHQSGTNASLELRHLEITDSGIYQLSVERYYAGSPDKLFIYTIFLNVEEALSTPLIVQDPVYITNNVQLTCIVRKGNPKKLLWLKGNKPITNSSLYILGDKNSTLIIYSAEKGHCGFYTCIAVDSTSERNISHFLLIDGFQFLHKCILITSVIAFVSTSMSLAGTAFIIFFALEKYKAQKYHTRLTIAFIVIKTKSCVCLMISSIYCILDTDFLVVCRVISGIVMFLLLAMTGYIAFLYLSPYREEVSSFLVIKRERYIILGSGIFNVIVSPLPIYGATENNMDTFKKNKSTLVKIRALPASEIYTVSSACYCDISRQTLPSGSQEKKMLKALKWESERWC